MILEIKEIDRFRGRVHVVDLESDNEYFSHGLEALEDIHMIDEDGDTEFLKWLASSGMFEME